MDTSLDHECASIHCVACCPRAQGYDDGFEFARKMYGTRVTFTPPTWVYLVLAIVIVATVAVILQVRKHDSAS